MEGGGKATRPNAPITFDKISTLGTSSQGGPRDPGPPRPPGPPGPPEMSFVMVNVSLAKTTGEIKICGDPDMYENLGGGEQFFYLSVRASRHPRDPSSYPRSAQLFLHVNGKVPLSGQVTQYKMYGGGLQRETAHRVVGLITDKVFHLLLILKQKYIMTAHSWGRWTLTCLLVSSTLETKRPHSRPWIS